MTAPTDRNISDWLRKVQARWESHYDEPFSEAATTERLIEAWGREETITETVEALRISFVVERLHAKEAEEAPLAESLTAAAAQEPEEEGPVAVTVESPSFPAPLSFDAPDKEEAIRAIASSISEADVEYTLHVNRGLLTPSDAQPDEEEEAEA